MAWALLLLLSATPAPAADTLVVCPPALQPALAPWVAYRTAEGHGIVQVAGWSNAELTRKNIRARLAGSAIRFVLIVGDALAGGAPQRGAEASTVPACSAVAKVITRYGGEATIGSDNGYADLDDDQLPDVAIGRLTADNPSELATIVEKILAYERNEDFGPWRNRLNLLAGVGGFGALADAAIETAARRVIATNVPPSVALRITYGNWRSPYCPNPFRLRQTAIDSLSEGSLCWVYLGHAWHDRLANLSVPGGELPSLGRADLARVKSAHGAPIACLLSCYTGAFDMPSDCLAEAMLAQPGGPVAIVCGSRVTMPYAMAVLGTELLDELYRQRTPTLGQALQNAKRRMVRPGAKTASRVGLDALGALINPNSLDEELAEHLQLFNLIGDPLLRLRMPEAVIVECADRVTAGSELEIRFTSSVKGKATVELICQRERLNFRPPARPQFTAEAAQLAEFEETYRRANEPALARAEVAVTDEPTVVRLLAPLAAKGECHVRVVVSGDSAQATGWADVTVLAPPAGAR